MKGKPSTELSVPPDIVAAVYFIQELNDYTPKQLEHYHCFLIAGQLAENEQQHRFNLPSAILSPDEYDFWCKHDFLTIDEFAALLIERKPEAVNIDKVMNQTEPCNTGRQFAEIYRLLERAQKMNRLDEYATPTDLINWAILKDLDVPKALKTKATRYAVLDSCTKDTNNVIQLPNAESPMNDEPKFATTKKMETQLKLLAGAMIHGYGLDLDNKRHDQIRELTEDVKSLGLSISIETTREHVMNALDLVPRKTKLRINKPNSVRG